MLSQVISQGAVTTDSIAVEDECCRYSYAKLAADVAHISRILTEKLGSPEARLAIELSRSYGSIVLLLAALDSGTTFCFIDPEKDLAYRRFRYEAGGITHRVSDFQSSEGDPTIDLLTTGVAEAPTQGHKIDYITFTSGSTGLPKAIAGSIRGVEEFVAWQVDRFGLGNNDRFLQLTFPQFDVYLRDILTPLAAGACIVIPPTAALADLSAAFEELTITAVHIVPSIALRGARVSEDTCYLGLKHVFFAGEMLRSQLVQSWARMFPKSEIVNLYGPSECTLASFFHICDPQTTAVNMPVGKPWGNTDWKLNAAGEVVIMPEFPALGYLENGAIPNPGQFQEFCTRDIGENCNGVLSLLGRSDSVVKRNGSGIKLTLLEQTLLGIPAVGDCVVTYDERQGITAFVETASSEVTHTRCYDAVFEHLPMEYWDFQTYICETFPLLPNGKIDRQALTARVKNSDSGPDNCKNPKSPVLCRIIEQVLNTEATPDADIFELGANSLDVANIAALATTSGIPVSVFDIFRGRSVNGIIAQASRMGPSNSVDAANSVGAPEFGGSWPLSPHQRRYVRVYLPKGNRNWANMVGELKLDQPVDVDRLRVALRSLFRRHDALRLAFAGQGPSMQQYEVSAEDIDHRFEDVLLSKEDFEAFRSQPIALDSWPIMRVHLSEDRKCITWAMHHLISDGISQGLIRGELAALLSKESLPPPSGNYLEFVAQSERIDSAHEQYWRGVFEKPYRHQYLTPGIGTSMRKADGIRLTQKVPAEFIELAAKMGVTPFTLLIRQMFHVFMAHQGSNDLVIGTPASGRLDPQFDRSVGLFISLVCMRAAREEIALDFPSSCRVVQEKILAAMEHQEYQYDQVMDLLGIPEDEDRFPITGLFASQVESNESLDQWDGVVEDMGIEVKFDVMIYLLRSPSGWGMQIQARKSLFSKEQLARLGADILQVNSHMIRGTFDDE